MVTIASFWPGRVSTLIWFKVSALLEFWRDGLLGKLLMTRLKRCRR
jgi:hypothetical protein